MDILNYILGLTFLHFHLLLELYCGWVIMFDLVWLFSLLLQRIQYAKTDSDIIMKGRGTYGDKEKKKDKKKKAQEPTAVVAKKLPPVSHIYFRLLRGFF